MTNCLLLLPLCVFFCVGSYLCNVFLCVLSSVAIILLMKREFVALLQLFSCCHVAGSVLCLFLVVPLVGLQCVIVAYPGHTRMFYYNPV